MLFHNMLRRMYITTRAIASWRCMTHVGVGKHSSKVCCKWSSDNQLGGILPLSTISDKPRRCPAHPFLASVFEPKKTPLNAPYRH